MNLGYHDGQLPSLVRPLRGSEGNIRFVHIPLLGVNEGLDMAPIPRGSGIEGLAGFRAHLAAQIRVSRLRSGPGQ
jgi:hypothetical protein